jgi:uncharacterized membrane protein YeaQ/YmgE (transglycosylase-associated protein family)
MFYSIWLLAAALAGWAAGKIAGDDGFGTGADILLGLTGAFVVRWSLENIGISLKEVHLLLFSIWGAAAFLAALLDATIGQRLDPDSKAISPILLVSSYHNFAKSGVPVRWRVTAPECDRKGRLKS